MRQMDLQKKRSDWKRAEKQQGSYGKHSAYGGKKSPDAIEKEKPEGIDIDNNLCNHDLSLQKSIVMVRISDNVYRDVTGMWHPFLLTDV